ncbi:MAG: SIS domain-containing protein [Candidatus Omnitrophota bacterium]|nr:SIS domain-containing protein [Candidatus Omnitrophota bacterium]
MSEVIMNTLEEIFKESGLRADYFRKYGDYVQKLISEIDVESLKRAVDCFLEARKNDKTIYFAGNGGSAATASHFAQDLSEVGRKIRGKGFRAQSINDNSSALTAISNDYGYEDVFSLQIQYSFNAGDVLVVISASGNSPNVVKAVELAKERGGRTVALVGFDGGRLAQICDHAVHIKSKKGEYGPVEDVHLILNHMIVSYLMMELKKES